MWLIDCESVRGRETNRQRASELIGRESGRDIQRERWKEAGGVSGLRKGRARERKVEMEGERGDSERKTESKRVGRETRKRDKKGGRERGSGRERRERETDSDRESRDWGRERSLLERESFRARETDRERERDLDRERQRDRTFLLRDTWLGRRSDKNGGGQTLELAMELLRLGEEMGKEVAFCTGIFFLLQISSPPKASEFWFAAQIHAKNSSKFDRNTEDQRVDFGIERKPVSSKKILISESRENQFLPKKKVCSWAFLPEDKYLPVEER